MKYRQLITIAVLVLMGQLALAQAQPKIFIKASGIATSESLTPGHIGTSGWMEIYKVSVSAVNDKLIVTDSPSNRSNNPNAIPQLEAIGFIQAKNRNSGKFFEQIVKGIPFETIEIEFTKIISGSFQTYMTYKITDAFVIAISDNNDFTESIKLVGKTLKITYKPINPNTGELGTEISYGWNFKTNQVAP